MHWFLLAAVLSPNQPELPILKGVKRAIFLGDSITYSGQYIDYLEAFLTIRYPDTRYELINLGLPSETVSGLSEPGHAGGQFARPCLFERLDRVLSKTKPDLVLACYGMNDGIYYPPGEERFRAYRDGIQRLVATAKKAGARVVLLTPPVFDPEPVKKNTLPAGLPEYRQPYVGYDDVLTQYTHWLLDQRKRGWTVIDFHASLRRYLDDRRKTDKNYALAPDGVHMGADGHRVAASVLLQGLGLKPPIEVEKLDNTTLLGLIHNRQRILCDAWLKETGHKRPGMPPGMPLADAQALAAKQESVIRAEARKLNLR